MSVTKNNRLVNLVQKQIAGGIEKKAAINTPQARFEKLGTIFSRTTGLIKSRVIPPNEIPIWYSLYQAFPPKYEPRYMRPPLNIEVKEIFYPEDKARASTRNWTALDLNSAPQNTTQKPASITDIVAEAAKIQDIEMQ